jgi:hypothetical protein
MGALDEMLKQQGKRPWNIHIKRFSSKWHFLRYAARYLRRPPIAEDRIISMTDECVEYWVNDLKLKAWVRTKASVEEFLELLIQHVPDKYAHAIRYFGLASPAGKHLFSSAIFALLGEEEKPRPKRLSFEAMSLKYFDSNPLLDSHGSVCAGLDGKARRFRSQRHSATIYLFEHSASIPSQQIRNGMEQCTFLVITG